MTTVSCERRLRSSVSPALSTAKQVRLPSDCSGQNPHKGLALRRSCLLGAERQGARARAALINHPTHPLSQVIQNILLRYYNGRESYFREEAGLSMATFFT